MKSTEKYNDPLGQLLREHGSVKPDEGFSRRLLHTVVNSYKLSYKTVYRKEERMGKWIIGVLIASALLIFYELHPGPAVIEILLPVMFLVLGLIAIVLMLKSSHPANPRLHRTDFRHEQKEIPSS
ncbi:hypothetical protein [Pedobacter sp. JY14-1]|uniref:hypothetical protein n=1 Tax=Pedobacter sp. JY14-1 TaxID=3034151 RepID=UPI0023E1E061|nr:hypothetical protein [Pedobacter sp. JY14-1]